MRSSNSDAVSEHLNDRIKIPVYDAPGIMSSVIVSEGRGPTLSGLAVLEQKNLAGSESNLRRLWRWLEIIEIAAHPVHLHQQMCFFAIASR